MRRCPENFLEWLLPYKEGTFSQTHTQILTLNEQGSGGVQYNNQMIKVFSKLPPAHCAFKINRGREAKSQTQEHKSYGTHKNAEIYHFLFKWLFFKYYLIWNSPIPVRMNICYHIIISLWKYPLPCKPAGNGTFLAGGGHQDMRCLTLLAALSGWLLPFPVSFSPLLLLWQLFLLCKDMSFYLPLSRSLPLLNWPAVKIQIAPLYFIISHLMGPKWLISTA